MRLGIFGYGNLGRAAELAVRKNPDIELVRVFSRRDPGSVRTFGAPVSPAGDIERFKDEIDVLFIAGGSATDLPVLTPELAKTFNVIDSYDNHSSIPAHFERTDEAAKGSGHIALISAGWDPGLFSLARIYSQAVLPDAGAYTFWGRGVSQGHSDAIRRIEGVADARQYTVPREEALAAVRGGLSPNLTARQMHLRDCYVVAEEGADLERIEKEIKTMPAYFADYDTEVHFISKEELQEKHSGLPHGGFVIRSGKTGVNGEHSQSFEFSLALDSNPEFTSSVIVAYARAIWRMRQEGITGCQTAFDVPPRYLTNLTREEMLSHML